MASVFNGLVPVFLLIATGYLGRIGGLVEAGGWTGLERLTYFIFFPAVIVHTLARADLSRVPLLSAAGIRSLLEGRQAALGRGLTFRAVNADGLVRDVLVAAGVAGLLSPQLAPANRGT